MSKLIILSIFMFSNLAIANQNLFHLDYKQVKTIAWNYMKVNHPEYKASEIEFSSININFREGKKFRNLANISFTHNIPISEKLSVDRKYKMVKIKKKHISMSITPSGKVTNYSEGKSTSISTQKIKLKKQK